MNIHRRWWFVDSRKQPTFYTDEKLAAKLSHVSTSIEVPCSKLQGIRLLLRFNNPQQKSIFHLCICYPWVSKYLKFFICLYIYRLPFKQGMSSDTILQTLIGGQHRNSSQDLLQTSSGTTRFQAATKRPVFRRQRSR